MSVGKYLKAFETHWGIIALRYLFSIIAATVILSLSDAPVKHSVVAQALGDVRAVGIGALFVYPLIVFAVRTVKQGLAETKNRAGAFVEKMIRRYVFFAAALWLIDHLGDGFYWLIVHHRQQVAGFLVAALLVGWIMQRTGEHDGVRGGSGNAKAGIGIARSLREQGTISDDIRRITAAHEAGHALVYAALQHRPETLRVELFDDGTHPDAWGAVSCQTDPYQMSRRIVAEWYMLMCQGGRLGERVLHGETTLGADSDQRKWLRAAITFLVNCPERGLYYSGETTRQQHESNDRMLTAMAHEQWHMLARFFDDNLDLLRELSAALYDQGSLGYNELEAFLSRAVVPDEMPRPEHIQTSK